MVSVVSQPFPTADAVHAQPKLESRPFGLTSEFQPAGDQPHTIQQLVEGTPCFQISFRSFSCTDRAYEL